MHTFPTTFLSSAAGGGGGGAPYVNSVQHVSITIPTSSTSATATISSVGSRAFILFDGQQGTSSSTSNVSYARVELTNATTVTAYRNTSSGSETCTVKCVVVDATSSLIASVQFGTITFGASDTSKTATVSSTNASYTVVHPLGFITNQASTAYGNIENVLSISGTTVTSTRQFSGPTMTVGFVVIEFNSAACNSAVQSYSKSWTNSSNSTTQTITSIDTTKTLLIHAGSYANSGSNAARCEQNAVLTNATTVTIATNTAGSIGCVYNFFVVEFASGVLASNVQRGTTTLTGAASNTSTISSVDTTTTLVSYLGATSTQTTAGITHVLTNAALINSTTVTIARNGSTNNVTGSWEVAEFN